MTGAYATGIPGGGGQRRAASRLASYSVKWPAPLPAPTRHPGSKPPGHLVVARRRKRSKALRRSRS